MRHTALILALLLAPALHAQTAQVIVLSPDEAKQAATLYAQKDAIDANIAALKRAIKDKYINTPCSITGIGPTCGMSWVLDSEFSTDFKAIVPMSVPTAPYMPCGGINWLTATPATTFYGAKP